MKRNLKDEAQYTRRPAERMLLDWTIESGLFDRYLFDCDGYQIANPPKGLEKVDPRLAVLARDSARRAALAAADEDYPGAYNAYSSKLIGTESLPSS